MGAGTLLSRMQPVDPQTCPGVSESPRLSGFQFQDTFSKSLPEPLLRNDQLLPLQGHNSSVPPAPPAAWQLRPSAQSSARTQWAPHIRGQSLGLTHHIHGTMYDQLPHHTCFPKTRYSTGT